MRVLVTGCAGFIGMYCAERLLARGDEVIGVDNLSPYSPVALKRARLESVYNALRGRDAKTGIENPEKRAEQFAIMQQGHCSPYSGLRSRPNYRRPPNSEPPAVILARKSQISEFLVAVARSGHLAEAETEAPRHRSARCD